MQTAKNLEILQCRICYDSAFNLRQLTNLPENCPSRIASGKTYAQLLLEVCNINVMDDMPLGKWPQFICLNCSHKLILAHDFIHQTHQVNNRLKSMANLMKTSEESVFIEKPALDIPLEFKIEKEEDDDLLNEREFLYSPIEAEALNARTPLPSKENCAQRTNVKNINSKQKEVLAEFMSEHPNFAKNLLSNCGRGRIVANRLWETLTVRLNSFGPPIKNSKIWRRVYRDQKFNVKKKISLNKASKKKTGGGPYEEILLSSAEEQILQAAGIDVPVEGLSTVKTFGSANNTSGTCNDSNESFQSPVDTSFSLEVDSEKRIEEEHTSKLTTKPTKSFTKEAVKLELLKCNIAKVEEHQMSMSSKLDRLIEIKERSLRIKELEHPENMKIKKIEYEIKTRELEILKTQMLKE